MEEKKPRPFVYGSITFLLCFSALMCIWLFWFIYRYSEDISRNHISFSIVIKLVLLAGASLLAIALPISIMVAMVVLYRKLSRQNDFNLKRAIKNSLATASSISITGFIWIAFLSPVINLHLGGLLYAIRLKEPDKPLVRSNLNLFRGNYDMINITEINNYQDSALQRKAPIKHEAIQCLKSNVNYLEIPKLLENDTVKMLELNMNDIAQADTDHVFNLKSKKRLMAYLWQISQDIWEIDFKINRLEVQRQKMIAFPFILITMYFMGMFIGVLNRNSKYLAIILLSIYFTLFPVFYYLSVWLEKLSLLQKISPFLGQFYYLLILAVSTMLLFIYAKRMHNREAKLTEY